MSTAWLPGVDIVLPVPKLTRCSDELEHLRVEARLDRSDGDFAPVSAEVAAVKWRGAAEKMTSTFHWGMAGEACDHGHQRGGTVHHGYIDDLPFARALTFPQRGHDTEGCVQRAAAEVAHEIEWRDRRPGLCTDGRQ